MVVGFTTTSAISAYHHYIRELESCELESCELEPCELEPCELESCELEPCELEPCELESWFMARCTQYNIK